MSEVNGKVRRRVKKRRRKSEDDNMSKKEEQTKVVRFFYRGRDVLQDFKKQTNKKHLCTSVFQTKMT